MSKLLSDFRGKPISKPSTKPSEKSTDESRRAKLALLRRSKTSEREFARWMVKHDGADTRMSGLTTSTGRIGHVTNIRADTLSKTFLGENKNERLNAKLARYWQLICEKSIEWGKSPILHLEPPNAKDYPVARKPLPDLYILDRTTLEYLLACKRRVEESDGGGS